MTTATVSTTALPALAAVPGAAEVSAAAELFTAVGTRMLSTVRTVTATWGGLGGPGVYETPDTERTLQAAAVLQTLADIVQENAVTARRALRDYASALATLETRRVGLQSDADAVARVAALEPRSPDHPVLGPDPGDVAQRIIAFNGDVDAADEACAAALRRLHQVSSNLLTDGVQVAGSTGPGVAMGLAQGVLERYRRTLVRPGRPLPALVRPATRRVLASLQDLDWKKPSDLRELAARVGRVDRFPDVDLRRLGVDGTLASRPALSPEGVVPVAERAAKGLGAAGVVIGVATTGIDQYQTNERVHPEWPDQKKASDAVGDGLIEGGAAAAGGWAAAGAGAEAGVQIGAIVGTFVGPEGTVIGAVAGGLIGGVAGGIAGSMVGQKLGHELHSLVSDMTDGWL